MEISTVTNDIATSDIKCKCSSSLSRPPTGHTVFKCKDCNKWHHHNCMVGDKQILPATLRTGYVCDACIGAARSLSARKGAATKRRLRGLIESHFIERSSDAHTTSAKPSANVSSRHYPDLNGVSTPACRDHGPTQMRFQLPEITLKPRSAQNDDVSGSDEGMQDADTLLDKPGMSGVSRNRAADQGKCTRKRVREGGATDTQRPKRHHNATGLPSMSCDTTTEELGQSRKQDHDEEYLNIICVCKTELEDDMSNYTECISCRALQHKPCNITDISGTGILLGIPNNICIDCRRIRYENLKETQAKRVQRAKMYVEEAERKQRSAALQREAALNHICLQSMWKHYCSLPGSNATDLAVLEVTKMHFTNDGRLVPVHAPPATWSTALLTSIEDLRVAAGDIIPKVCGSDKKALCLKYPDRLLRTLREISLAVVHRGAYKGQKHLLGVLGEVIGLVEKGSVWKG